MDIQWEKWVIESLPGRLRRSQVIALCMAYCVPIQALYGEFVRWRRKMRIKSGGSPQACMLQKIVKDSLGVNVVIQESNGKPVDFIVQTAFTDMDKERQLFALLDRYKLAGKSYSYENAEVMYEAQWTGYVCEKVKEVNLITFTYHWAYDESWGATIIKKIIIRPEKPIGSRLYFEMTLYVLGYHEAPKKADFFREPGYEGEEMDSWVMDKHENEHVSPTSDEHYEYRVKVEDIYG